MSVVLVITILVSGNDAFIACSSFKEIASVICASVEYLPLAPGSVPPCPASIIIVFIFDPVGLICAKSPKGIDTKNNMHISGKMLRYMG